MSENADSSEPVLAFENVTIESPPGYDTGLRSTSFRLMPGELCLVRLDWESTQVPLADLACGVLEPDEGVVRFCGEDWSRMGFGQATRERGRIGRSFEGVGWVGNLDVDENILLAERHHTRRPEAQLKAEAETLAREFGLEQLPHGRPSQVPRPDLARAALVRAFMGSPKLLLLERPTSAAFPDVIPALLRRITAARGRGTAVLWLTNRPETWQDARVEATCRYKMTDDQLLPA